VTDRERNVEHVCRMLAAHNDGALLERFDEFFHPDLEWVPAVVGGLEGSSYRGREGMRRYYAERDETFVEGRVEIMSCEAVADGVVLVLARSTGRGRASGAMIDEEVGIVLTLRGRKITRDCAYTSHAAARAAAQAEATVDA
jgi:ketosteroid isomerase-like protein